MTVPLDPITHKNLMLIKRIYQRAVVQSAALHSEVDLILALISFDLANETLLKNAITAVDSRAKYGSDINDFITKADEVFSKANPVIPPVPDAQKVKQVRKIRNGAMHEARYPTVSDINDCRTYTRDFLQQMYTNVWAKDFTTLSLTDMIHHPKAKEFLEKAELEIKNGNVIKAVGYAKAGFQLVTGKVKHSVVGRYADSMRDYIEVAGKRFSIAHWTDAVKKTTDAVFLSVVGLNYPSYHRYKKLSGGVNMFIYPDGSMDTRIGVPKPTIEDAEYIINYAINAVIQIEDLVGDIEKPFEL